MPSTHGTRPCWRLMPTHSSVPHMHAVFAYTLARVCDQCPFYAGIRAEPEKKTLKAGTNKCGLTCKVAGAKVPAKPIEKRLASTMKVSQLKTMCKKLFGVEPADLVLYFRAEGLLSPPNCQNLNLDPNSHLKRQAPHTLC